jgi:hypothetical protein
MRKKANLQGLIPSPVVWPEKLKNEHHGEGDGWRTQKLPFSKTKGGYWRKVCGMSTTDGKLAYLGLNSPTSRRAGKAAVKVHDIRGHTRDSQATKGWTWCGSDSLAHLIPCHTSSSSKIGPNNDVYSVWYDTIREGNSQGLSLSRPPTRYHSRATEQWNTKQFRFAGIFWLPATFHPHLKLIFMTMCTQAFEFYNMGAS